MPPALTTAPTATASAERSSHRALLAGIVGNILEWYDFALYGYFARLFGELYFPAAQPIASTMAAWGVFLGSFLMRPLGALWFGHLGDKVGRKRALELSVLLMAGPTLLLACLPTYDTLGVTAPVLLTLLRLLQGVSVGGEYTSSVSFMIEHAPAHRRGLHGSLGTCGAIIGILLGSLAATSVQAWLPAAAVRSYGWRLPFLLGSLVALVALYVRRHLHETPSFEALRARGQIAANPLAEAFTDRWRAMLHAAFLYALGSAMFYIVYFYLATHLTQVHGIAPATAQGTTSLSLLVLAVGLPAAAHLSDRIGRRPVLLLGCLGTALLAVPLFGLIDTPATALGAQLLLTLVASLVMGPIPATLTELFPARTRFSGFSIGYNASLALFGGTAPLLATWLVGRTGDPVAPAYYLAACALISALASLRVRDSHRRALLQ
jgi:MHS family proline/betaine transporter-like MFS transporter